MRKASFVSVLATVYVRIIKITSTKRKTLGNKEREAKTFLALPKGGEGRGYTCEAL